MARETFNQNSDFTSNALSQLSENARSQMVIAGHSALQIAMAERVGRPDLPSQITMTADPEVYSYLREQPVWEELTGANDEEISLHHTVAPIRIDRDDRHAELVSRSWTSNQLGLQVIGIPDAYARAQDGDDREHMLSAEIRRWLHDPSLPPLPDYMLSHEYAELQSCLPEHLSTDAEAPKFLQLAANGLFTVYTLYGHPKIRRANQIIGDLEYPAYRVPALYHNGFWVTDDLPPLVRHFTNIGVPIRDALLGVVADVYSDSVYGNGRRSDNPEGHDELRSAELLAAHAQSIGLCQEAAQRLKRIVMGTGFDERTRQQVGQRDEDPVVRGVCGIDLETLTSVRSVLDSFAIAAEDGFSARASRARTIGKVLLRHNYRITSLEQALAAIDAHADERPDDAPDGPTAKQAMALRLQSAAAFTIGHEYPSDWTLDNKILRHAHSQKLHALSSRLLTDSNFTVGQAHEDSLEYTAGLLDRMS